MVKEESVKNADTEKKQNAETEKKRRDIVMELRERVWPRFVPLRLT